MLPTNTYEVMLGFPLFIYQIPIDISTKPANQTTSKAHKDYYVVYWHSKRIVLFKDLSLFSGCNHRYERQRERIKYERGEVA